MLIRQQTVQRGVILRQRVGGVTFQRQRHIVQAALRGNNRDEFGVAVVMIVQRLRDHHAFESDAAPAVRIISAIALQVQRRADDQDKIRLFNLVFHPALPAFRRKPIDVLVDLAIQAIPAQIVGQIPHEFPVCIRVVAVTDENAGGWIHE